MRHFKARVTVPCFFRGQQHVTWTLSFLLKNFCRYLQEIGYIDKVVELRSARVKMLLGLTSEEANGPTAPESVDQKSHLPNHTAPRVIASKPNEPLTQPGSVDAEKDKDIEDELVKKSPQFAVK